jgi:hypothetical protein
VGPNELFSPIKFDSDSHDIAEKLLELTMNNSKPLIKM